MSIKPKYLLSKALPCVATAIACALLWALFSAEVLLAEGDPEPNQRGLLQAFQVYVPPNPVDCGGIDPWAEGRQALADGGFVPSGGCLQLRYALREAAIVYLLHEDPSGRLKRLLPAGCGVLEKAALRGGEHRFPAPVGDWERVLKLDTEPGVERFYLLALPAAQASRSVQRFLDGIPPAGGRCEVAPDTAPQVPQLRRLMREQGAALHWRIFAFNHY